MYLETVLNDSYANLVNFDDMRCRRKGVLEDIGDNFLYLRVAMFVDITANVSDICEYINYTTFN